MTAPRMTDIAARTTLVGLMIVGGLVLWIGVPAGVLWGLGELVDTKSQHLLLGLVAVPLGMAVCGIFLVKLNRAYLNVTDPVEVPGTKPSGGPLESIVAACAAVAIIGFVVWMIFGTKGVAPLW